MNRNEEFFELLTDLETNNTRSPIFAHHLQHIKQLMK